MTAMEEASKVAAREGGRLLRLLSRWGAILALAIAIGPSSAYLALAIHHDGEDFDAALQRRAHAVARHAFTSGSHWSFEAYRLEALIQPVRWEVGDSNYRVEVERDGEWQTVASAWSLDLHPWLSISRSVDVVEVDRVIARIVGEHEVTHELELILLVALASCLLGAGVLLLIRFRAVPFLAASIARLERHEAELAAERAGLERLVGDRTVELSAANMRLETALEREREINQQQRRFVSVVSHEFRTPLTIIDGAAQRLARNAARAGPEDIHERVQKIRRAVARMGELIETSLSAARLDSGAVSMNRERVALATLLDAICERIRSIAPDFTVDVDCADPEVAVHGDPRLLDQVFTNLLSNAVKYSGASRAVEVVLTSSGDEAVVAVRDHGLGIPAEELPKLFARFYRASTAQGLPGTGIGLNLARELVAMHGGAIDVASEVGAGSTFTVRLPRLAREDQVAVQAA